MVSIATINVHNFTDAEGNCSFVKIQQLLKVNKNIDIDIDIICLQEVYKKEYGQAIAKELQEAESNLTSRIQTVEQAIIDNDVRGLNSKLAQLATNMQQILEQQKVLLDLRSQVDKATTITDGIGDKLDVLQTEVDDIWKAYDELASNPL